MKHQRLIDLRKSKGISQEKIAKKLAMEQTTYSKKERGLSPINDSEWLRIAKALEVSVSELKNIDDCKELIYLEQIQQLKEENELLKQQLNRKD